MKFTIENINTAADRVWEIMVYVFQVHHHHAGLSSKEFIDADSILSNVEIKKGDNFLDAGCGDGYFSMAASKLVGEKGRVFAVDIYEVALDFLKTDIKKKGISNIEPIVADMTKHLPIESKSIDVCFMANILHGFVENKEVDNVFKELRRVIKPKSILAVVEFKKIESHGPPIEVRLKPDYVENLIAKLGFKKVILEDIGPYHYFMQFKK